MSDAVVFKKSLSIALVSVLNAILPTCCAIAGLYAAERAYNIPIDNAFLVLVIAVAVLSLGLLQPRGDITSRLSAGRAAISVEVVLRWLMLLSILFAIGYATKSSAIYSRRVILTWAIVTPCLLVVASMMVYELMHRVLSDPANMRRVIIAGCNDVSVALAKRLQEH